MPAPVAVRHPRLLLAVAVLIIAANLRASIAGVGPLLAQIADDLGTTEAALGLLAAIPLIAFAVVSPLAHGMSTRLGMSQTVLWSLIALAAGTVWRSLPGSPVNLWAGTVLIGASLAIVNVLLPAVIRRDFSDRVAGMTGLFTAFLAGTGALASGVVVPISHIVVDGDEIGWRWALLWSGSLVTLAIAAWGAHLLTRRGAADRRREREPVPVDQVEAPTSRAGMWGDPVAWLVLIYMGAQAMWFYMLITWLAPFALTLGRSEVVAGIDVMLLQVCSLIGSLSVPFLLRAPGLARWTPALIPVVGIIGVTGLITVPAFFIGWVLICGLASGASLSMTFTLFGLRARSAVAAGRLSGMAQSGGYAIAAIGPVAFGGLLSLTGGWLAPFLLVVFTLVVQVTVGGFVGRNRHVESGVAGARERSGKLF
ncbi:MFS transporter [Agromyces sp. Marseille-P2726]|uniref:MFS transporter n=1 Tax=Agromyces sp. Marseille-P2726 TaxID=2709132 RepID=UPI0020C2E77E|nr:MFS transporter [Agromyces sp. Marseille-P2726]